MTVVSENDRVVDLVEYQNQQEEDDKVGPATIVKSTVDYWRTAKFDWNSENLKHSIYRFLSAVQGECALQQRQADAQAKCALQEEPRSRTR